MSVRAQEELYGVGRDDSSARCDSSARELGGLGAVAGETQRSKVLEAASAAALDDREDVVGLPESPADPHQRSARADFNRALETAGQSARLFEELGTVSAAPEVAEPPQPLHGVEPAARTDAPIALEHALSRGARGRSDSKGFHARLGADRPAGRFHRTAAFAAERFSVGVPPARPVGAPEESLKLPAHDLTARDRSVPDGRRGGGRAAIGTCGRIRRSGGR